MISSYLQIILFSISSRSLFIIIHLISIMAFEYYYYLMGLLMIVITHSMASESTLLYIFLILILIEPMLISVHHNIGFIELKIFDMEKIILISNDYIYLNLLYLNMD